MESIKSLREYAWLMTANESSERKRLNKLADNIEAEVAERYVELPVDADGEVIRIGDVMEWIDLDGEVSVTCSVDAIGVGCFFAWDGGNGRYAQKCANAYRHYQSPTVESTLREMLAEIGEGGVYAEALLLAKYAPRLRLAGDAE